MVESANNPAAVSPRKAWLAALLSLLLPGLGQMYNAQLKKGAYFYLGAGLTGFLALLKALSWPLWVVAGLLLLHLLLKLAAVADAALSARRLRGAFRPTNYNRPLAYLAVFLVFGVQVEAFVTTAVRQTVVQAYDVPSASMKPTLLPGDYLLVAREDIVFVRGDIVVFEVPADAGKDRPRDFIKRIVGLPGDEIEIRAKQLLVNGLPLQENYIVHADAKVMPAAVGPRDDFGPVRVPAGHYFVLGDNRDHSYDSRFWGSVPGDRVHGKAVRLYWSWDPADRKVRWARIGAEIR